MSELTRDAMRSILGSSSRDDRISGDLEEFRTQISELERQVNELKVRMNSSSHEGKS